MKVKLSVKGLEFAYDSVPVLKGLTLDIREGRMVSILGPNGCGKSTFLKCVNQVLSPKTGLVEVDGEKVSGISRRELAKRMSYVPQSSVRVFPHTVFDVILMGRRPHLGWTGSGEDEERVWDVIDLLGLEDIALSSFNALSGGQQQKALIGRALVQETGFMLLDEPTSNLDLWHQMDVMRIVEELVAEGKITAMMAVHDLNMAAKYSDDIIMMKNGQIIAAGEPWEVLTPENISGVYGVEAEVRDLGDGKTPLVVPIRQMRSDCCMPVPP
ncbi:ABC transporter ATP-binding protein [Methanoplanus limicola]|uniref:Cobalamin import ATP-binding protein BtuD n=1 Tax=Methanoplanus limicola DSM 2279 TaxID=937775 RepID=H1Z3E0_9EURY|nr:ABC transporter ATP-binding protein [Methanoplanus limicola]EHQ36555.1 ABC transporter related protein [Methanoplanus limicola DSM 2279]